MLMGVQLSVCVLFINFLDKSILLSVVEKAASQIAFHSLEQ
jgi:hypothetical protein